MRSKRSKKIGKRKTPQTRLKKPLGISVEQFLKSPNKRRKFLLAVLLSLIVLTFWRYLSFEYLYLFRDIGTDSVTIFYPNFLFSSYHLRTEGIPLWSFCKGLGQGVYSSEIFVNPFKWILYALGNDKLAYGIAYVEALKILVIGVLYFVYARIVGFTRFTCLIGCLFMAFSGYAILGSAWYGHSKFVLDGLVVLLAFELLFKKNKWWLFPLSILLLIGTRLYFVSVFLLIYSLFRFIDSKGWRPKALVEFYLKMGILGFIGIVLTAPFLGSTIYKFLYSPRVAGDVSYVDKLSNRSIFSLEAPLHYVTVVMRFFSNNLLGGGSDYHGWKNYLEAPEFYCGLLTLLLIPQLFTLLNQRRKIVYACFLAFWAWIILFPYFRYAFYLFVGDYYKNALSLFIPFSLLFVGMMGLNLIHRGGKVHVKVLFATLAILLLLLHFPYDVAKGIINTKLQLIITLLLITHTAILYLWQSRKSYRYRLQWILLLTVCFEVVYLSSVTMNDRIAFSVKEFNKRTLYNDYTKDAIDYIKSIDDGFYRIDKTYSCFTKNKASSNNIVIGSPNDSKALNYYGTSSYDSHNHRYYVRFLQESELIEKGDEIASRWLVGLVAHPLLESLVGVKYLLTKPESDDFVDRFVFEEIHEIEGIKIYQNKYSLPMGVAYDRFVPFSEFQKLENKTQKELTFLQAVVLEDEDIAKFSALKQKSLEDINQAYEVNLLIDELRSSSLQMSYHNNNRIEGAVNLLQPKMMFFSIPYDIGWSAKVNGQTANLELVNTGFMGLMLPSGNQTIELSYIPPYFYEGWIVFFFGVILYLYLVWRTYGRKIKHHFNGIN